MQQPITPEMLDRFGRYMRAARHGHPEPARRLQSGLAEATGWTVRRVWELETGRYLPTDEEVAVLCALLPLLPVLLQVDGVERVAP